MFDYLDTPKNTPRTIKTIKPYLNTGIRLYRAFGVFFLFNSIVLFVSVVITTRNLFPSVMLLPFWAVGYFLLRKHTSEVRKRKDIYVHGNIVYAQVLKQGKKFNPFKSWRDYTLLVRPEGSERFIELVHPSEKIWQGAPVGSYIVGLTYKGEYLFGEEMGRRFWVSER